MSKHVWRMREDHVLATAIWEQRRTSDCTIIPDRACFPVKEAMRVVAMAEEVEASITEDGSMLVPELAYLARISRLGDALFKYRKARDRMKARKNKKANK